MKFHINKRESLKFRPLKSTVYNLVFRRLVKRQGLGFFKIFANYQASE